ncbi:MAG: septum formation initiator family protein [Saprospiraceae bacterium]|nr:septum formation initiator family protein [Saprospiraceae bacterium]
MSNSGDRLFFYVRKIAQLLLNKYILAMTIFVVWLLFFDKNSIITQWSLRQSIHQLEDEKAYLHKEIELTKEIKKDLSQNREKYAREKFFMKKPGERVFIIE